MNIKTVSLTCCILFASYGCSSIGERINTAALLAAANKLDTAVIDTGKFRLLTYRRLERNATVVTVYIEGDGYAFAGRHRVSTNPTPKNPLSLKLALLDNSANVIYIARPCQYVPLENEKNCHPDYWTIKRYAPEVITSINQVINYYQQHAGFENIRLVGYSGGGTVAAILAAQRNDVLDLRTLAGNMDIEAFTQLHEVTPLSGSLNPKAFANDLSRVPQLHLLGDKDDVITDAIIDNYLHSLKKYDPDLNCVYVRRLSGISHVEGWEEMWQRLHNETIKCR